MKLDIQTESLSKGRRSLQKFPKGSSLAVSRHTPPLLSLARNLFLIVLLATVVLQVWCLRLILLSGLLLFVLVSN